MKKILILLFLPVIAMGQIQPDKVKHFVAGAVIGGTTQFLTYKATGNKNTAFLVGFGMGTLAGISKEIYDKKSGKGVPSKADAIYTSAGALSVGFTLRFTIK